GRRWSSKMMKAVKLKESLLPDLGESHQAMGKLTVQAAKLCGLPAGIPIAGGGADNACGALGVGLINPGEAVASWGTSGTVLGVTKKPKIDPLLRAHTFCHAAPNKWYVMGVMLTAGSAFSWLRDELAKELPQLGSEKKLIKEAM